jgi:hypothetical protein
VQVASSSRSQLADLSGVREHTPMPGIGDHREPGAGDRLRELPGAARRETEILLEGNSQQGYRDFCPAGSVPTISLSPRRPVESSASGLVGPPLPERQGLSLNPPVK